MAEKREILRLRLRRLNLTQVWLIDKLNRKGISVDKALLSSVLSGSYARPKAEEIIDAAHGVLDEYESKYLNST